MIYLISDGSGFIKIGVAQSIESRLAGLQCGNPRKLYIIKTIRLRSASKTKDYWVEDALHKKYESFRVKGSEWFDAKGLGDLLDTDNLDKHYVLRNCGLSKEEFNVTDYLSVYGKHFTSIHRLTDYLDANTISAILKNDIDTVEALKRAISGRYRPRWIGEKRLSLIAEAIKTYEGA